LAKSAQLSKSAQCKLTATSVRQQVNAGSGS